MIAREQLPSLSLVFAAVAVAVAVAAIIAMAQLRKMQLSGVRLFDPNDPQVIKFCPLTLILGVNGAGKTTVIEALRYATSGETPPGSSNGRFWITDPAICSTVSIPFSSYLIGDPDRVSLHFFLLIRRARSGVRSS